MGVQGNWKSVGKATFLRAANAPILTGARVVTTPIAVTVDSENPIGPPPAAAP
ncbi:MAG: hypothetical protein JWP55_2579 [Mycobacterium sp.]|jgi:hypothetical protein|nr:hypothetical protein [Mycobacterium sp.]